MSKIPGKVIPTKDHSFRVEITDDELANRSVPQKDFWSDWMNINRDQEQWWTSLTKEQKIAYQKAWTWKGRRHDLV